MIVGEEVAMKIEVTPSDVRSMLDLFPDAPPDDGTPVGRFRALGALRGTEIPGPEGTTVRYDGLIEYRGVDIGPDLVFVLVAAKVGGKVAEKIVVDAIARWMVDTFRGRASKVTIDRREIDLDDEGNVRRIVEEEIKARR
jgi:hypothetical protein